ncbi:MULTISPECIES: hypothetical protein [Corynebacterium]|nr:MULTISPECIES: hypothetical protein [Corynebacterium]WNI13372.1 hypothetical protein RIU96_02710 [Corynebacterium sp. Z-1]
MVRSKKEAEKDNKDERDNQRPTLPPAITLEREEVHKFNQAPNG